MSDRRVLLTVSGVIPCTLDADIEAGRRPRADYRALAAAMDADITDFTQPRGRFRRVTQLVQRLVPAELLLAWRVFRARRRYDVILTDGEQIGLPLAALMRLRRGHRPRHVMIVHVLTTKTKRAVFHWLGLAPFIDRMLVYSSRQRELIINAMGYPAGAAVLIPFMVDADFFSVGRARAAETNHRPTICAAGLELRDYPTLIEAVRGLDVDCVIAAGSLWSRRSDSSSGVSTPPNVTVCSLPHDQLRDLYARSRLVVVPLYETDFQAGITTILEAMSMERAVICTRTRGQTDAIVDGDSGLYVPPGDVAALRSAIERLLADPTEAARLGRRGRETVLQRAALGQYASSIAALVDELRPADPAGPATGASTGGR